MGLPQADWTNALDFYRRAITRVEVEADTALNDSDKSFTAAALEIWEIVSVQVNLISTVTVGNRQMTVEVQDDASNVLFTAKAGAVQAASLTRDYTFAPGLPNDTAFGGPGSDFLATRLPIIELAAAWLVRVYDSAAIDAAADDMTVRVMVRKRVEP